MFDFLFMEFNNNMIKVQTLRKSQKKSYFPSRNTITKTLIHNCGPGFRQRKIKEKVKFGYLYFCITKIHTFHILFY